MRLTPEDNYLPCVVILFHNVNDIYVDHRPAFISHFSIVHNSPLLDNTGSTTIILDLLLCLCL